MMILLTAITVIMTIITVINTVQFTSLNNVSKTANIISEKSKINEDQFEIVMPLQDIHIDKGLNDDDRVAIIQYKKTGELFIIYKGYRKGVIVAL
jgi:hypothetical protein